MELTVRFVVVGKNPLGDSFSYPPKDVQVFSGLQAGTWRDFFGNLVLVKQGV